MKRTYFLLVETNAFVFFSTQFGEHTPHTCLRQQSGPEPASLSSMQPSTCDQQPNTNTLARFDVDCTRQSHLSFTLPS